MYTLFWWNWKTREHLEDPGVYGDNTKMNLNKNKFLSVFSTTCYGRQNFVVFVFILRGKNLISSDILQYVPSYWHNCSMFHHSNTTAVCSIILTQLQYVPSYWHNYSMFHHTDTTTVCSIIVTQLQYVPSYWHNCSMFHHSNTTAVCSIIVTQLQYVPS